MRDLRPRILTALAMVAVAALPLGAGGWAATLFISVVAAAMGWEFRRIVASDAPVVDHAAFAALFGLAALLAGSGAAPAGVAALGIGILGFSARDAATGRRWFWAPAGGATAGLAAAAFSALRAEPADGLNLALWVAVIVAATDTGAYFAGRLIGGPKLWPRVSPKKTWAGLGGGVALATLAGLVFSALTTGTLVEQVAPISALAAIVAQGGDLAESALKRRFDVKDSSGLLPGHGGVLDRLDGFCAVSLVAAAVTFSRGMPVFRW
jgi:phosphatidate cytidylyltransferase